MLVEIENRMKDDGEYAFIDIRDLQVHFKSSFELGAGISNEKIVKAVRGVSLKIARGEILAIVGESGSGKTTLGRAIVGLVKPTAGEVILDGAKVNFRDRKSLRSLWRTTQMIFQDPYSTFNPLSTIQDALLVPVRKFGLAHGEKDELELIHTTLENVGLNPQEVEQKYPNELSGGQRQRASIARALVVQPKIIIADEPVSMLDVSLRAGILDLLRNLNERNNLTVIFITHDLAVAQHISDRTAVMYRGKIVELAQSKDLIRSPIHPYTELLLRSAPRLKGEQGWSEKQEMVFRQIDKSLTGCMFYPRCPLGIERCISEDPELLKVKDSRYVACHVRSASA